MTSSGLIFQLIARVAWHDSRWNGSVFRQPSCNAFCAVLDRIREERDDAREDAIAGKQWTALEPDDLPACNQRAFSFLQARKIELGIARDLDVSDIHVEVIDLLANRVEAELGVAFFVACYSALRKAPVSSALLILGNMSVQGNIKPLRSLTEPLHNGAKRALIPSENKRNLLDVSADIMEHVDPIFFGDAKTAAMKVLGG